MTGWKDTLRSLTLGRYDKRGMCLDGREVGEIDFIATLQNDRVEGYAPLAALGRYDKRGMSLLGWYDKRGMCLLGRYDRRWIGVARGKGKYFNIF